MYQSSPLALPNGAIDGYRTLPITGATFLTGYSTEYVMTLNSSKQVVQNYCAYNATTCTSSILTDFVSNNVQISATDAYVKNYTAYLKRIYALKTDGTVQLYQSSPLALPSGAIDGYRTLPITGAKMISAYTTEDVLTINSSKQIVQYTCPYNATTCTSSILTDFGSNNVQVSGNSEYIKSYTTYLNRIYTLKADGTVQLYQASNINLPNGGVDGYRTLPITGAKAIAAFGSEELLVLNSSNQVVKYSCLYNTTTCTSTILTDFGTL